MAFDAFEEFVPPSDNPPSVEGEDQAPAFQSPTAVELQDEVVPETREKAADAMSASKP
jgi:hypothetical protein